jgi:hypothetical protein
MAETRQIGNLKIQFLGDSAAQLASSFDNSYSGSESFRGAMSETARTFKNIYVGSSLGDLKDQPGFDNAGFDPNSPFTQSTSGYGKASDTQTFFLVVTGKEHTLIQDGQSFTGSTDLVLIHELLHPSQFIRDLTGNGVGVLSEINTQMREQVIAQELGKIPGQDFPDVIDTGVPYTVKLSSPGAQPYRVELGDPTVSIDPIRFEDTFGHPFDGSPGDIILLKAALVEGSIAGRGEYVSPSGPDRYDAPFDSSDKDKIVLSAGESDRAVSIVQKGAIKQIIQNNNNGSGENKLFDPDNTHPYNELDIFTDASKNVTGVQVKLDKDDATRSTNGSVADLSVIGQVFGSAIGRALAPDNQFGHLLGSTVGGLIGQKLAQNFAASLTFDASKGTNADFTTFSGLDVASAAAGSVASFLIAEIGTKLGLQGYGAQLFNNGTSAFTGSILSTVIHEGGLQVLAQEATWATAFATAEGAIGGTLGGLAAQSLVHPESKQGAVGGQLLGAVGSALGVSFVVSQALGGLLNFVIPGVGSFFGTILGTMLGDAIAGDPGSPKATHDVEILGSDYHFQNRLVGTDDHGNAAVSQKMGAEVVIIANNFLDALHGAAIDHRGKLYIGYNGDGPYGYIAGWFPNGTETAPRFNDPNDAIQEGVRELLMQTEVIGGDLLLKRAQHAFITGSHPDPYSDPDQLQGPDRPQRRPAHRAGF